MEDPKPQLRRCAPKHQSITHSASRSNNAPKAAIRKVSGVEIKSPKTSKLGPSIRQVTTESSPSPNPAIRRRRISTGGLAEKHPVSLSKGNNSSKITRISSKPAPDSSGQLLPDSRRKSLPYVAVKLINHRCSSETKKLGSPSSICTPSKMSPVSNPIKRNSKLTPSSSASSSKIAGCSSLRNSGVERAVNVISSPPIRNSPISSGRKIGVGSSSLNAKSSSSVRRKASIQQSSDSRRIYLPETEVKAADDLIMDLRGKRIRHLDASVFNHSSQAELVYLSDNLLSSLNGVQILTHVKVLDLSFNHFKGSGLESLVNCQFLQQLYLAGNKITSLTSLPELPNLEFLSVEQNHLKSLNMTCQPCLKVLAASRNEISTFRDFPILPVLEHLLMEDNPVVHLEHVEAACVLLVGHTLKKFNDRDISEKELEIVEHYSPNSAFCLRIGWAFSGPEAAKELTFGFLANHWKGQFPPGLTLMEASIDCPHEEEPCHCHFTFTLENASSKYENVMLKYQWLIGDKSTSNFIPISNASEEVYLPKHDDIGKILKVECTPVIGDIEFPVVFSLSSPVERGNGFPKVLNIEVYGDLVEGNLIRGSVDIAWCGGTPSKGVVSWLRRMHNEDPVVIAEAEDMEYRLTINDVNSCLMFVYVPVTTEGIKGEPRYRYTNPIQAGFPSVKNVHIIGDVIEGNVIKGCGMYFGGWEGPSKFKWLREDKERGDFLFVLNCEIEYVVTEKDIGLRLAFVYKPVNIEGNDGESVTAISEPVRRAPPRVKNLKLEGELVESSKVTVTGTVTGGTEGSSMVQWFKTRVSIMVDENELVLMSSQKITKAFRIPFGAIGFYIVAKYTPMSMDGEFGDPVFAISENPVQPQFPNVNFVSVFGDIVEGELLTASYGYVGGNEGKSICNWYLHKVETDSGTIVSNASGILQYRIMKSAIGKFISFRCTPIRDDGTVGAEKIYMTRQEVSPASPRLISVEIAGDTREGSNLYAHKKYCGGEEGSSLYRWFRCKGLGDIKSEIEGANTEKYESLLDDIGYFICYSCEPVRNDGVSGPPMFSELIGPIMSGLPTCQSIEILGKTIEGRQLSFAVLYRGGVKGNCSQKWFRVGSDGDEEMIGCDEFLNLTTDDVGKCVKLVYTPVRSDGVSGNSVNILSNVVSPGDPAGLDLQLPDCWEEKEVIPVKVYFGGEEGIGEYIWYKTKNKLPETSLINIENIPGVIPCGNSLTYTPSLDDVGAYLGLYWIPVRVDGKHGEPLISFCSNPVSPSPPVVLNVRVKEISFGIYYGEGTYFGGHEGLSRFDWYRETNDGALVLIDSGSNERSYEVTDADYNCRLLFGYTPVRTDSVCGELKLSEPTAVLFPEPLEIEMIALVGKAIEGEVITAVEVIPNNVRQHYVWEKYKKIIKYQWFLSSEGGDGVSFVPLLSHNTCSYKVRLDDIGRHLRCECTVTDVFSRSSEPASAETPSIQPGAPTILKLDVEGGGFHTNLYAVRATYVGGKEGKSRVQWLRSMVGSPDLISIPGETGLTYQGCVDDVGYKLVAVYTPVRGDGVEGEAVSASTDPISAEPGILKEVRQKVELGFVKFEVFWQKEQQSPSKKVLGGGGGGGGSLERRILEVKRKRVKVVKPGSKTSFPTTDISGSYAPPFHVEVFRNDNHRMRIMVEGKEEGEKVELIVQTRHMRDVMVLTLREFAQKFNTTSLGSLLKVES